MESGLQEYLQSLYSGESTHHWIGAVAVRQLVSRVPARCRAGEFAQELNHASFRAVPVATVLQL